VGAKAAAVGGELDGKVGRRRALRKKLKEET
jgi:hypothetical protein